MVLLFFYTSKNLNCIGALSFFYCSKNLNCIGVQSFFQICSHIFMIFEVKLE